MTSIPSLLRRTLDASHTDALIAEASGDDGSKDEWTVLSIWWRADNANHPFLAVVEPRMAYGEHPGRARNAACGTLGSALRFFEDSWLKDELIASIPDGAEERYPDSRTQRMREAAVRRAERFYTGPSNIESAIDWLYDGEGFETGGGVLNHARNERFAVDWGVNLSEVELALTFMPEQPGFTGGFIRALRHLDRAAWRRGMDE